jgi:hypothetical protein
VDDAVKMLAVGILQKWGVSLSLAGSFLFTYGGGGKLWGYASCLGTVRGGMVPRL